MMRMEIAITQAAGLRRVAADLDRVWVGHLKGGDRTTPADEFLGSMLAAPVLRALAAELALKAVAIKTTGAHKRGHDLLKLFDALGPEDTNGHRAAAQGRGRAGCAWVCAVHPRQAQRRLHRFAVCRGDAARLEADVCVRG